LLEVTGIELMDTGTLLLPGEYDLGINVKIRFPTQYDISTLSKFQVPPQELVAGTNISSIIIGIWNTGAIYLTPLIHVSFRFTQTSHADV
jgi:hypothetical protein